MISWLWSTRRRRTASGLIAAQRELIAALHNELAAKNRLIDELQKRKQGAIPFRLPHELTVELLAKRAQLLKAGASLDDPGWEQPVNKELWEEMEGRVGSPPRFLGFTLVLAGAA